MMTILDSKGLTQTEQETPLGGSAVSSTKVFASSFHTVLPQVMAPHCALQAMRDDLPWLT